MLFQMLIYPILSYAIPTISLPILSMRLITLKLNYEKYNLKRKGVSIHKCCYECQSLSAFLCHSIKNVLSHLLSTSFRLLCVTVSLSAFHLK